MSILTLGVFCLPPPGPLRLRRFPPNAKEHRIWGKRMNKEIDMKKVFVLLVLLSFILAGCASPQMAQFVQLPDATRLGITAVVIAVVGLAFAWIGGQLPWTVPFLSKYKEEISLTLAAALIGLIENALPSAYPEISILVVELVLAVLAAVGLFKLLAKAGVRGFRAG